MHSLQASMRCNQQSNVQCTEGLALQKVWIRYRGNKIEVLTLLGIPCVPLCPACTVQERLHCRCHRMLVRWAVDEA